MGRRTRLLLSTGILLWNLCPAQQSDEVLILNDAGYFETRGLNFLVYSNFYDGNFSDAKIAGIEIIHHGARTATNGDVRLSPTPGQWDPVPQLVRRTVKKDERTIEVHLSYPNHRFEYQIRATAEGKGVTLTVHLEKPLPVELEGRAGFNLEFLPSAYFEKSFLMDSSFGHFPLYPTGTMATTPWGAREPSPIATGRRLVLAPEDPTRRIAVQAEDCELGLYDGRQQAQNGWFIVRTLLPSNKAGDVIRWSLTGHTIPQWTRSPVITHSQVGYAPA
ncbi:MAG: glycoside hydrolase, partial [Bacteroidetes bacterium]|nr:glycoside hydrolase [Bacteroidota bacterium]